MTTIIKIAVQSFGLQKMIARLMPLISFASSTRRLQRYCGLPNSQDSTRACGRHSNEIIASTDSHASFGSGLCDRHALALRLLFAGQTNLRKGDRRQTGPTNGEKKLDRRSDLRRWFNAFCAAPAAVRPVESTADLVGATWIANQIRRTVCAVY